MSAETILVDVLESIAGDQVYAGVASDSGVTYPYITWTIAGGESTNFVDSQTSPSKRNGRYQINVWARRLDQAVAMARQVEAALRAKPELQTTVEGEIFADYEEDTKLHGTIQDFSFWTDR